MNRTAAIDEFLYSPEYSMALLESSCDWAFITDNDFIICYCRKCRSADYEILPGNLIGQSLAKFFPKENRQDIMAALHPDNILPGKGLETIYADPMSGPHLLKAVPLEEDSGRNGYSVTVRRISGKGPGFALRDRNSGSAADQNISVQLLQQRLIAELSTEYTKSADTDYLFPYTIQVLGNFLKVNRCSIFKHDSENKTYSVIYEWCAPGITSTKDFLQDIPYNEEDEGFIQLTTRPYIAVDDTFQFSGEAYKVQRENGVHSFVDLPLIVEGHFWGFLGADYSSGPHYWTESEFHMLQTISVIMGTSLEKKAILDRLENAILEAKQASQAKTDFLSRMSHEIRTPMNAIIGMNEIAKKSGDPERVYYCLGKIEQASHQLLGIINDILDLSKIESGKMEIIPAAFDYERMLQNVYNVVQTRVEEKNLEFIFDFEDAVKRSIVSDELRLTQVITNLLSNAVKFTPEGGKISLKSRFLHKTPTDALLRVEVRDTGIGIGKEDQAKLFNSFEQADRTITHRFGGTGLGLSICKKILDLMGGDIRVESQPGEGSCFTFEVRTQLGSPVARPEFLPDLRSAKVLVADDNPDVLDYCSHIIRGFKMRCDTAAGGEEALRLAGRAAESGAPYNVIFLDWKMPGMDGLEAARVIRESVSPDSIVIMISSAEWSQLRRQANEIGVTRFLAKPLLPSALFNTIIEVIGNAPLEKSAPESRGVYLWDEKTILVVEDIEINQEILCSLLEPTGVKICCADNGVEALKYYYANHQNCDLILMDVQMPKMDGYEATKRIRSSGLSSAGSVPIIAMTANAFAEDIQKCLAVGMNDHVAKPIDVDELMGTLHRYLA